MANLKKCRDNYVNELQLDGLDEASGGVILVEVNWALENYKFW